MKTPLTVLAVTLLASAAYAAEPDKRQVIAQADTEKPATESAAFTYKPPLRGAPATRVGGGTRSVEARAVTLSVLAPNETGYTTRDKPTIYWYVSEAINSPVELTVTTTEPLRDAATPALELTLQPPISRGVHALRLEEHGVVLKPGVDYHWFVAVVSNPAQRSSDVVAGGSIQRIANADAVQIRLKQAPQALWPAVYAEGGLWYDAIDQLSKLISADPANRRLRQQRAALLEQVGLVEAAAFDRGAGR
jgi:hypothetical protein